MSYSLDTPSAQSLKAEARALRQDRQHAGTPITHGAALEEVARAHGYRDWNTARADLPDRIALPFQVGMRVRGHYLELPFTGLIVGLQLMGTGGNALVSVHFDEPVNITPDFMFALYRQRVSSIVDVRGISPAKRSNGTPHMHLLRA